MEQKGLPGTTPTGLHLLLARADDLELVLPSGLPEEAAQGAPKPKKLPGRVDVPSLEQPDAHPNDLPAQRWGVVAPEGEEGEVLLRAVASLMEHRGQQQGEDARVYRVRADMDAKQAEAWLRNVYEDETVVPEEERPKYLLLLGDLHQVSMEFQQVVTHRSYVGRLHVGTPSGEPDLAGYRAYVEKVLASEARAEPDEAAEVLLYCADDGSPATTLGRMLLVEPCKAQLETWTKRPSALRVQVLQGESMGREALLHTGSAARSGVLLSVSHGLGKPRRGWGSLEQQHALQGALRLANRELVTAEVLRDTSFLPGGMWFCLACFGAATPPRSAFHAWLKLLTQQSGQEEVAQAALESLPKEGERPFLAALPQAALANPRGPLAVIGHSDLAWTYGFTTAGAPSKSRASRICSVLKTLVNGSRAGVALDALMRAFREVNFGLTTEYEQRENAGGQGGLETVNLVEHAERWMERNDLQGYVLLGDPAARLSLRSSGG